MVYVSTDQQSKRKKTHERIVRGDRWKAPPSVFIGWLINWNGSHQDVVKKSWKVVKFKDEEAQVSELYIIKRLIITLIFCAVDTPDPYVKLLIPTSPHGVRKTTVKRNEVNPIWDEVFYFYLDPALLNLLRK